MNNKEFVYNELKVIKGKTPILLIGGAMKAFKSLYKGNIHRVNTSDEARAFVEEFTGVEYNKLIVIEDISNLRRDELLLKLIEEAKFPLIMLASKDNVIPTILSRTKYIIKLRDGNPVAYKNRSIKDTWTIVQDNELTGEALGDFLAENCVDLLLLNDKIRSNKIRDSIIQIYGGLERNEKSR